MLGQAMGAVRGGGAEATHMWLRKGSHDEDVTVLHGHSGRSLLAPDFRTVGHRAGRHRTDRRHRTRRPGRRAAGRAHDAAQPGDRRHPHGHHRGRRPLRVSGAAARTLHGEGRAVGLCDRGGVRHRDHHRPRAAARLRAAAADAGRDDHGQGRRAGRRHDAGGDRRRRHAAADRDAAAQLAQLPLAGAARAGHDGRRDAIVLRDGQRRRIDDLQRHRQRRRRHDQQLGRGRRAASGSAGGRRRRVQGDQRRVEGRVRPRHRRRRPGGHQVGHQPAARHGVRVLPQQVAQRPRRVRSGQAGVQAQSVRRQRRRPDRARPRALLRRLRADRHRRVLHRQHRTAAVLRVARRDVPAAVVPQPVLAPRRLADEQRAKRRSPATSARTKRKRARAAAAPWRRDATRRFRAARSWPGTRGSAARVSSTTSSSSTRTRRSTDIPAAATSGRPRDRFPPSARAGRRGSTAFRR